MSVFCVIFTLNHLAILSEIICIRENCTSNSEGIPFGPDSINLFSENVVENLIHFRDNIPKILYVFSRFPLLWSWNLQYMNTIALTQGTV